MPPNVDSPSYRVARLRSLPRRASFPNEFDARDARALADNRGADWILRRTLDAPMAVPEFQAFLLPLLVAAADRQPHRMRDLVPALSDTLSLSDEDRAKRLSSGTQTVAENRVYWSGTYLRKAGLLTSPARGTVVITDEGLRVLAAHPSRIDKAFLSQYPSFREFAMGAGAQTADRTSGATAAAPLQADISPEERIDSGWQEITSALAQDLLELLKRVSPGFFEGVVVDLLLAMGYGGSRADASRLVGKSGDGGIDGTISEDKLGLDMVYVQAKRWEGSVGREVVQAFAGSLEGFRAQKGVLLTTSHFTSAARDYVGQIGKKIVLIDGPRLVELMVEHDVGVETAKMYEIKKIDHDYFEEAGPLD
jgi:restriction system protein